MHKITILHRLRNSPFSRQFLRCFVLALLIVQWGLIQHLESHLSGGDTDNCEICMVGNHMANAMSFTPPSVPVAPPHAELQTTLEQKPGSSPLIVFLARAPPLSIT
jgi:hypothetical protein